ncbi:hypothetical protein KSP40_PGU016712 [Platanthera guangdongensis]|uniref:Uncharacterized protein n=1 Tax=Platanthera guangdongensis TaxID=2320717 RepID=A0ABR2LU70_9ASPA
MRVCFDICFLLPSLSPSASLLPAPNNRGGSFRISSPGASPLLPPPLRLCSVPPPPRPLPPGRASSTAAPIGPPSSTPSTPTSVGSSSITETSSTPPITLSSTPLFPPTTILIMFPSLAAPTVSPAYLRHCLHRSPTLAVLQLDIATF